MREDGVKVTPIPAATLAARLAEIATITLGYNGFLQFASTDRVLDRDAVPVRNLFFGELDAISDVNRCIMIHLPGR